MHFGCTGADSFHVEEEWSYIDSESRESRTIDILATRGLYNEGGLRIRPILNLVIECKQAELPYVFFLTQRKIRMLRFPIIAGLFGDEINLTTDDSRSSWTLPILSALSLNDHRFVFGEPRWSATFSKCVRKGKDLELSGSDAFNAIVLPLTKALHHFKKSEQPAETVKYFDCHIAIGCAILDAPMIGAEISEKGQKLSVLPWVRILKHESYESEDWTKRSGMYAIDVVHKDFFSEYLEKHVLPFADEFSKRALRHREEIAEGKGFAPGLEKNSWKELESRMKAR